MARLVPLHVARHQVQGIGTVVVDKRIRGDSLERAVPTLQTERDLVHFFKELYSIPIDNVLLAAGVTQRQGEAESLPGASWDALTRLQRRCQLPSNVALPAEAEWFRPRQPSAPSVVLSHADLKGEHILVHADGSLAGIIDWADATIASPSNDIGGLSISVGAVMAARVGLAIGLSKGEVEDGIWRARYETALRLDERLNGSDVDSPIELLKVQMRRAFEGDEVSVNDAFS